MLFWVNGHGYHEFYYGSFVIVHIAVVWSGEYGDDCWEFIETIPLVHLKPLNLRFMGPNNRY